MKRTFLTFFLLCSLLGYYFFVEVKKETIQKEIALSELDLFPIPEDARITKMKIFRAEESYEVEGKDDLWRVIDPVIEMGDPLIIGGMERVLSLQKREKIITKDPKDLGQYGLEEPDIRIGILGSHMNDYRYLRLGKIVPFEDNYYAKWEDENSVFTISQNARNTFDKGLFSVRDKTVFKISLYDKIKSVTVRLAPHYIHLAHDQERGQWVIEQPFAELGKTEKVEALLKDIQTLFISDFLSHEDVSKEKYGFYDGNDILKIRTEKGQELYLKLGKLTEDGEAYYAQTTGRAVPVTILKSKIDVLRIDPVELIDRRILFFQSDQIQEFTYEKRSRIEVLRYEKDQYHLNGVPLSEEQAGGFQEFLQFLENLQYKLILNDEGVQEFGLSEEDPLFHIRFIETNAEGAVLEDGIHVYHQDDGYFIQRDDDNLFYEVEEEQYKELLSYLEFIYDQEPASSAEPGDPKEVPAA